MTLELERPENVTTSLADWFTHEEVAMKRDQVAKIIRTLTEEQRGDPVIWPTINFRGG